jgi:predicted KAP-like P-loop ATPase
MKEQFETEPALTVVDFNPWMFSGTNQLMTFFFQEIGAELKVRGVNRFGKAADWFAQYAGVLKPIAGFVPLPGATVVAEALAGAASGVAATTDADRSVKKLRDEIRKELLALENPIVVVIDDIDRLTTAEIREIFKLVRLTASFPNIIYVLAFDRKRVEDALSEDGIPGRAYLEKIVQLSFDVPQVPEKLRRSQVFKELDSVLGQVAGGDLNESRWSDVYFEVIDPLLDNMRDVTRYAISSRATIKSLGKEVDLVDLLALEAVRIFRPEIIPALSRLRTELTRVRSYADRVDERAKMQVEQLLETFKDDQELILRLLRQIFPAARQYVENHGYGHDSVNEWRKDHRLAHIDYLNLYLDRVAPDELAAFRSAEHAFSLLADRTSLATYLSQLDPAALEDVLQGLEVYERTFPIEAITPASITLLNLIDSMPKNKARGLFDLGRPDLSVGRVILRMLRRVDDESEREAIASEIIPELETYSSHLDFLTTIGYQDGAGHKLVSEAYATAAEGTFVEKVLAAAPTDAKREWDALRVYWTVKEKTGNPPLKTEKDSSLIRAVFESAKSTNRSQSFDSRHVKMTEVLAWSTLIEVFGTEKAIKTAANLVRKEDKSAEILTVVDKYLGGWRPDSDRERDD